MKKIILLTSILLCAYSSINATEKPVRYKNLFIRWKPIKGAFGYKIQVNDKKNKQIINKSISDRQVTLRIPEGEFKLRIGSLNRSKKVENWSDWKNITILVKNPPAAPGKLHAKKIITSRNTMDIQLSWQPPAKNKNAKIKYILFDISSGQAINITTTKTLNHTIKKLKRGHNYTFKLFALNAYGEESEKGTTTIIEDWNIPMALSLKAGFIMPFQTFGELFEYGFGGNLRYTFNNIFIDNFFLGPETGYYYMKGNNTFSYDHYPTDSAHIIPISIITGYNLNLSTSWSIEPSLSIGIAANILQYNNYEKTTSKTFWDPIIKTGITGYYHLNSNIAFSLCAEHTVLIENDDIMQFFIFSAGTQYTIDFI